MFPNNKKTLFVFFVSFFARYLTTPLAPCLDNNRMVVQWMLLSHSWYYIHPIHSWMPFLPLWLLLLLLPVSPLLWNTNDTVCSRANNNTVRFNIYINTSGNLVTSINNTQNGHKGISSNQGDSSVVGSPARRSEVSPIQNHVSTHPFII